MSLTFEDPLVVETFVALPEGAEGVVVEDIAAGGRSLLASSRLPLEMLLEGAFPISWGRPVVNVGELLVVRLRNASGEFRAPRLSVCGHSLVAPSPGVPPPHSPGPARGEELRDVVARHLRALLSECPGTMVVAATVVVTERKTSFLVAVNRDVSEGGPSPEVMKDGMVRVLNDYLGRCPNVVRTRSSGDAPS